MVTVIPPTACTRL